MADCSLLLLLFVIISTNSERESGILLKLPPYGSEEVVRVNENRVLNIFIDEENRLFVENTELEFEELKSFTKYFILNPDQCEDLPDTPRRSIVLLQHHRATNYKSFITVYDQLMSAYNEIWNERSIIEFGYSYSNTLPAHQRKAIKTYLPLLIIEKEPMDSYVLYK